MWPSLVVMAIAVADGRWIAVGNGGTTLAEACFGGARRL
jgi:hypothetical protein